MLPVGLPETLVLICHLGGSWVTVWLTGEQTPSARAFKAGGSSVIPTVRLCPGLPSPHRHSLAAMCPWPGPGWAKPGT